MKADAIILMGVAGCGKTSVGEALAAHGVWAYEDGDDLHPQANIKKMSAGIALGDDDRWPWLADIGKQLGASKTPLAIGCSALKKKYRDHITHSAGKPVYFVHLAGSRELIENRMSAREGHFMPTSLLDSQFADLEPLAENELGFAVSIDQPLSAIIEAIETKLGAL